MGGGRWMFLSTRARFKVDPVAGSLIHKVIHPKF